MALGRKESCRPSSIRCVVVEVRRSQLVLRRRRDSGVDRRYEVDGKEATPIVDSLAVQSITSTGRLPPRTELYVRLHTVHPVHHSLEDTHHVTSTRATKQLAEHLYGHSMEHIGHPDVKNTSWTREFVGWHFVEQLVGGYGGVDRRKNSRRRNDGSDTRCEQPIRCTTKSSSESNYNSKSTGITRGIGGGEEEHERKKKTEHA